MNLTHPQDRCLQVDADQLGTVVERVYGKVIRSSLEEPGFVILSLPPNTDSHQLRSAMVALKEELSLRHQSAHGEPLRYLSLGRFDQQRTTKLHLDGAPEVSFLMLGYEPTRVRSEFQIADFSRCAADLGLTPAQFMETHNPHVWRRRGAAGKLPDDRC